MKSLKNWALPILVAVLAGALAGAAVDTYKIATHNIMFGGNDTADKTFTFNVGAGSSNPVIRFHNGVLETSNDGLNFGGMGIPSGAIMEWGAQAAPVGWVLTDGTAYSRTDAHYARLYAAIGTTWGIGDGATTFNVPDLRGLTTRVPDPAALFDSEITSRTNYSHGVFGGTFTITADTTGSTSLINIDAADCANLAVGQLVTATTNNDIPAGTFITATNCGSNSATLSQTATGSNPAETVTLTNGSGGGAGSNLYAGSYESWYTGSHDHLVSVWNAASQGQTHVQLSGSLSFAGYEGTSGMENGNPGGETVPFNIYVWKIIKL